jgi:glycogen synthase
LRWALARALDLYRDRERWTRVMQNGMSRDFSLDTQAKAYVELYRRMIGS